jgi:hypothetical protein
MGIVRVIAPMLQMNRKEIIKLVLQMSFLIMALRQYLIAWRLVWLFVFKFDFTIFGNIRKLIG